MGQSSQIPEEIGAQQPLTTGIADSGATRLREPKTDGIEKRTWI